MATLKEFEEALREHGMHMALALLQRLRERDRAARSTRPARRITGQKMTPELARTVLELHATTGMTQQEIAFKVGVNQGRVNEVIKHGKWLSGDPNAPEAVARDEAKARMTKARSRARKAETASAPSQTSSEGKPVRAAKRGTARDKANRSGEKARTSRSVQGQLSLGDL